MATDSRLLSIRKEVQEERSTVRGGDGRVAHFANLCQEILDHAAGIQAQLSQAQAERDRWHDERNAPLSTVGAIRHAGLGWGVSEDQETWTRPGGRQLMAVNFPPSGCVDCELKHTYSDGTGMYCTPKERRDSRRIAWVHRAP